MQRRNSTKSRALSRQKSASSVKSVQLVHVLPETAEHDAQHAAIKAFARARERSSNGVANWPPPRSSERPTPGRHQSSSGSHQSGPGLSRQRSVRFVQPKTSQTRLEEGVAQDTPSRQASTRTRTARLRSQILPPSKASANGMVFAAKGIAGDCIDALILGEAYYTPEDNIASVPSSYRRLRKSQSMYNGSEMKGVFAHGYRSSTAMQQCPNSDRRSLNGQRIIETGHVRLRAPRSTGFLKPKKEEPTVYDREYSAETTDKLDEKLPPIAHPRTIKSRPSMPLHQKSNRPDKLLKKTLRDVSNGTTALGAKVSKDGSLRLKAREVSHNFKHKLKTFFNITKADNDNVVLPPQQVEAQKAHGMNMKDPDYFFEDDYVSRRDMENTTVSRVTSGVPSLHAVPLEQQLHSRQGSLESLRSESKVSDEKSRVTSWSDSDPNTFGTANSSRGEWEKQRLSVIKESGSHLVSSHQRLPLHRHWVSNSVDMDKNASHRTPPARKVDGQRIYSALMKKFNDAHDLEQAVQIERQQRVTDFAVQGIVPTRESSKKFVVDGKITGTTIKHVAANQAPESDMSRVSSATTVTHGHKPAVADTSNLNELRGLSKSTSTNIPELAETRGLGLCSVADLSTSSLTSLKAGRLAPQTRTLSERSSIFFGSPSCHLFRTQSPYRRTVRGSMRAATDAAPPKSPEFNSWIKSLSAIRIRCPSAYESEDDQRLTYDESVYSEDAESVSGTPKNSRTVEESPNAPEQHGNATIYLDPPKHQSPDFQVAHRAASSTSSAEWKTWLSANMSGLNQSCLPLERSRTVEGGTVSSRLPWTPGHVRENAQISGYEDNETDKENVNASVALRKSSKDLQVGNNNWSASPDTTLRNEYQSSPLNGVKKFAKSPFRPRNRTVRVVPSLASLKVNAAHSNKPGDGDENHSPSSSQTKPLLQARSMSALGTRSRNIGIPISRQFKQQDSTKNYANPINSPLNAKLGDSESLRVRLPLSSQMKVENISPKVANKTNSFGAQPSGELGELGAGSSPDRECMGSKHMVELFLDSRRRRIDGTDDTDAFI